MDYLKNLEQISIESSVKTGGIMIFFPDPFDAEPSETTQFGVNRNRLTFEIKNEKLRKSITVTTSNSGI